MPPAIVKLASTILYKPSEVTVAPVSSTVDIIEQYVYFTDKGKKNALLVDILKDKNIKTALVFTRTKYGADKVARVISKQNVKADAIHGNKSQNARQRALKNFKDQTIRVLVATDIAARGIDIDDLSCVINYEIPNIAETYVHRIGRTGRAGAEGTAISFCDASEKEYLKDIEKLISKSITVVEDHDFPLTDHNPEKPPKQQQRNRNSGRGHARPKPSAKNKQKKWYGKPKSSR